MVPALAQAVALAVALALAGQAMAGLALAGLAHGRPAWPVCSAQAPFRIKWAGPGQEAQARLFGAYPFGTS